MFEFSKAKAAISGLVTIASTYPITKPYIDQAVSMTLSAAKTTVAFAGCAGLIYLGAKAANKIYQPSHITPWTRVENYLMDSRGWSFDETIDTIDKAKKIMGIGLLAISCLPMLVCSYNFLATRI